MYKVGIDLGGTNIKVGIINERQEIVKKDSVPTKVERPYQEIIKDMAELVQKLLKQVDVAADDVIGIGIGSPGTIDNKTGTVIYSNNFNWENVHLVEELHKYLNYPIAISNDANCAALGEVKAGAARDVKNVVLLTLGTGVGGGVVVDGKVLEGGPGGMELGHTMLRLQGEPCSCGRNGCLEAYASANALIRQTKEAAGKQPQSKIWEYCNQDLEQVNGKTVFDAALAGDATAQEVVQKYIMYLGEGIVDFVNIFRPEKVLLSGGVCNQGEALTNPLNSYIKKYCFAGEHGVIPEVICATLGNDAGMIGAAALIG